MNEKTQGGHLTKRCKRKEMVSGCCLILIFRSLSEIFFRGKVLYVSYKEGGDFWNLMGHACLLGVDVKNVPLLVALNKMKWFYPWSRFSILPASRSILIWGANFMPQHRFPLPAESLREEVVLKMKVETGWPFEWSVSQALGRTGTPQKWKACVC